MTTNNDLLNLITALTNHAIPVEAIEVTDIIEQTAWEYDTSYYTTTWGDNPQPVPLALRLYRSKLTFWQTQDNFKAERVWAVLRRLRLDSFPAPQPLAQGKFEGVRYLIWYQSQGQHWQSLPGNSMDTLQSLAPQLAQMLANLHHLNHNGLNNEPLYQATVAGTLVRMLLWSREMENNDLRRVITRLKPTVAEIQSWPHRLIHGEPTMENALALEGNITALTNWENAAIGDPRWDIMTAAHALRPHNPLLAEQFINWYETFTGKTVTERPFWYALISVRTWALKAWLAHAIANGKISPEESAWADDLATAQALAFEDLKLAGL